MHKNAKKQFDLQGLVQDQKLTLSYKDIVRFFFAAGSRSHERRWTPVGATCRPAGIPACYANEYASEHLEIHTGKSGEVVSLLKNCGSLFIGENTAEVYANKIAGPNHMLPTGAAARYTGGLWVGIVF